MDSPDDVSEKASTACTRCSLYNGAYVKYPHNRYTRPPRYYRTSVKTHCDGALWSEPAIKSSAKPLVKHGKNSPNKARARARASERQREKRGETKKYLRCPASPTNHRHLSSRRWLSAASMDSKKLDLHYFPAFQETLIHHPRHNFLSRIALRILILFSR